MNVVGSGDQGSMETIPQAARMMEDLGYDIFTTSETNHNPFLPLVLAAEHTTRIALQTSIALAFPRSPMDMAYIAWDLQKYSGGRMQIGLGTQVRGHVVRRFSGTWSSPAARMREYIKSMRAVWDCWQNDTKLEFVGEHYQMNLMPPFFNPGPIENPNVKVYIAAVNPRMHRVAGELCDGVLLHSFNTPKYTKDVILPSLREGARSAGRKLEDIDIHSGGMIITGATDEEIEAKRQATRSRIAFYGSTRSYEPVMATHGWEDTAKKLYRMSVEGRWNAMPAEITEEMLDAFAVTGTYDNIVNNIKATFGPYATSIGFSIPVRTGEDRDRLAEMVKSLHEG